MASLVRVFFPVSRGNSRSSRRNVENLAQKVLIAVFVEDQLAAVERLPRRCSRRLSEERFADYLVEIVASYPEANTIHLVMDNLSSHNRKGLVDRFGEKIGAMLWDRFTVHNTPKHGSWLNQAEIEISLFSRQCLGQRRIPSLGQLQREASAWNRKMNREWQEASRPTTTQVSIGLR
jgi:transposase